MIETIADLKWFLSALYGSKNPSEQRMREPVDPATLRQEMVGISEALDAIVRDQVVEGFITELGETVKPETQVGALAQMNDGRLPEFSWPGGYAIYYKDADGMVECPVCAQGHLEEGRFAPESWHVDWNDDQPKCTFCHNRVRQLRDNYSF